MIRPLQLLWIGAVLGFSSCVFVPLEEQLVTDEVFSAKKQVEGVSLTIEFQDEFDGSVVDTSLWTVADEPRRGGFSSPNAVSILPEGILQIKTYKEGDSFFTGFLTTKQTFLYGYFSARVKVVKTTGHWAAFWLYGITANYEMDILEYPSNGNNIEQTFHWNYGENQRYSEKHGICIENFQNNWHVVSLLWTPDKYCCFVDGKKTVERTIKKTVHGEISNEPANLFISEEINNGVWPTAGNIENAVLPDYFYVDWVRVYSPVP